jgi:PAS domain S-box-containing protein
MSKAKVTAPDNNLLYVISEATSGFTGHDFVLELTKKITEILDMEYCFVAECANKDKTRLRTIAFVNGQKVLDNIEYNTNESGCQMMMNGEPYFLASGAQNRFPAAKGIEAYVGAPILSPINGEVIGHLATTSSQAVTEEKNQTAVLKIFAARLGAELERIKAEKELMEKNDELRLQIKANEFYAFTMNHLREAVFWIDQDGNIWEVNDGAEELSGYSKEELRKMHVFDINASVQKPDWSFVWNRLKERKKVIFDAKFKRKDKSTIDIEITQNLMVYEGREYTCSIVRDIRQRKMEEDLLKTVSERTAGVTGEDYFRELTKFITTSLNVRYSMVVECSGGESTKLRMLSYVEHQEVLENIEYNTEGTPCEIVMQGKDFFCPNDLEKSFPKEKGIQSWIAVPIYSPSTGKVIGNIAAFDTLPMGKEQNQIAILKIFAARAGTELERIKAEEKLKIANTELEVLLKESEERFRDLFEEAPIAYVHEGLDSKFIKANRAALRTLGVKPEEVPYTYGKTMAPDTPETYEGSI